MWSGGRPKGGTPNGFEASAWYFRDEVLHRLFSSEIASPLRDLAHPIFRQIRSI